jgi:hypothetical protein
MATTDAKSGFRLPWSSDRPTDAADTTDEPNAEAAEIAWPAEEVAAQPAPDAAEATAAPVQAEAEAEPDHEPLAAAPAELAAAAKAKKPNKFLADLTKAMQAAAEDARSRALGQLQGEAKAHIETIHGRSATEAADLRRGADDDVAGIREWSKQEIARIREETEQRITDRKARLETEIEQHAAVIEHEIEAVQALVSGFEAEMAAFFERLLAEEDPTRFATMAENLPEPPSFDDLAAVVIPVAAAVAVEEPVAEVVTEEPEAAAESDEAVAEVMTEETSDEAVGAVETADEATDASETGEAFAQADDTGEAEAAVAESGEADVAEGGDQADGATFESGFAGTGEGGEGDTEMDREAAFAAIQAAAEAAASAEVAADAAARAEAVADVAIEIIGNHDGETEGEQDPRFAALGLSPDYDAAEAEALASAEASSDEDIPVIGDDALAARLAGLVPAKGKGAAGGDAAQTQVIVVGLVSVASIASFKRHLGRVSGVQSVGVSSGPDGEFVFAVSHTPETNLRDAIASLPSFQARVTSSSDGAVHVTAHDPEADG